MVGLMLTLAYWQKDNNLIHKRWNHITNIGSINRKNIDIQQNNKQSHEKSQH